LKKILLILLSFTILSFGSATIFSGKTQVLVFDSNPQGASVLIDGLKKGVTPLTLSLEKNKYKIIKFVKDNYIDRVVLLDTNFNFITLLGSYSSTTDLVNGAAWTYAPGSYYVELKKK
jgi:hypothetical protein